MYHIKCEQHIMYLTIEKISPFIISTYRLCQGTSASPLGLLENHWTTRWRIDMFMTCIGKKKLSINEARKR